MRRYISVLFVGAVLNSACAVTVGKKTEAPQPSPQTVSRPAPPVMSGRQAPSPRRPFGFTDTDQLFAEWDYAVSDEPNTVDFRLQVDSGIVLNLGKPLKSTTGTTNTYRAPIGAYAAGAHTAIVSACNTAGCTASAPASFSVETPVPVPVAPPPPSNLRITGVTPSTVALAWDDASTNEDGFAIEQDGTEIARTGPNATSTTAWGLMPATSYTFRARAFNTVGYSPYSSATMGTTLPPPPPPDSIVPTASISYFRRNGNSRNYSVTVQAADTGGVTRVVFLVDSRTVAVLTTPSSGTSQSGSYTISFTEGAIGSHVLTVQVFDAQGNRGTASRTFVR